MPAPSTVVTAPACSDAAVMPSAKPNGARPGSRASRSAPAPLTTRLDDVDVRVAALVKLAEVMTDVAFRVSREGCCGLPVTRRQRCDAYDAGTRTCPQPARAAARPAAS